MIINCAETYRIDGPIIRQRALQEGCTGDQIDGVTHGGPALKKDHFSAAGIRSTLRVMAEVQIVNIFVIVNLTGTDHDGLLSGGVGKCVTGGLSCIRGRAVSGLYSSFIDSISSRVCDCKRVSAV